MEKDTETLPNNERASLKDFILALVKWYRYLLSKWLIILFAGLVGGALGFTYSVLKKVKYVATTTFVLEEDKSSGGGALASLGGIASMAGLDIGGGGGIFQGDNIIELYKSRTMIKNTLLSYSTFNNKRQLLIDRYIETNKLREKWDSKPSLKNINFTDSAKFGISQDSLIGEIVKEINLNYLKVGKPDKKLSIIKVEFTYKDELFAKAFTDQIVQTVNNFYVITKTKKSQSNVDILEKQADSVRRIMYGAISKSASTLDATPNLNPTRQSLRTPVQKSQFNAETNKAVLGELVKNLELSKVALRKETPLIQVVDTPVLPLEKDRVGKATGIVIGGIIAGLLTVIVIVVRKFLKQILSDDYVHS